MERLKSFVVTVSLDLAHTVRIVCGVLTATSCLLCLVAPPCGMAYTMYRVMTPLVTAGTLHLTSAMLGVTSRTVTSRGADGAKIQISIIIELISGLYVRKTMDIAYPIHARAIHMQYSMCNGN